MRDKTYPVQVSFSDSLWARIRRRRTTVGPRIQRQRGKRKSGLENLNSLFYFDLVVSGPVSRTIWTVRPSCLVLTLVLKPSLSTSVTSSLSSPIVFCYYRAVVWLHTVVYAAHVRCALCHEIDMRIHVHVLQQTISCT